MATVTGAPISLEFEEMTPALRAIILFKAIKGGLQLVAAVAIFIALLLGISHQLAHLEIGLRQHFASGWSSRLAFWVARHANTRFLRIGGFAFSADGALSLVEAWALHHRHWWGPWLVVVASGCLLPLEILEIFRHPHLGRVLLFLLNAGVVAYLARRAMREHQERKEQRARQAAGLA